MDREYVRIGYLGHDFPELVTVKRYLQSNDEASLLIFKQLESSDKSVFRTNRTIRSGEGMGTEIKDVIDSAITDL